MIISQSVQAMKRTVRTIGSVDKLDLPFFGIEDLDCKIDTGADTSSLHCSKVRVVEKDGKEYLKFRVLDKKHPQFSKVDQLVSDFREKTVRSSNGESEIRYAIRTKVVLFGRTESITFTLADRGKMKFPVLLGKRFLKHKFLVDVAQNDLSYTEKVSAG
ncbi:MAG: hypothetical protein GC178_18595 [Flavobacteriales bacterium]|nr:hypothetical protein [Flavobacteriales bacterium]